MIEETKPKATETGTQEGPQALTQDIGTETQEPKGLTSVPQILRDELKASRFRIRGLEADIEVLNDELAKAKGFGTVQKLQEMARRNLEAGREIAELEAEISILKGKSEGLEKRCFRLGNEVANLRLQAKIDRDAVAAFETAAAPKHLATDKTDGDLAFESLDRTADAWVSSEDFLAKEQKLKEATDVLNAIGEQFGKSLAQAGSPKSLGDWLLGFLEHRSRADRERAFR